MPFVPHTEADVTGMLEEIGAPSIDALFDEIPEHLANGQLNAVPESMSELALMQLMQTRAAADDGYTCFMGAGSYDHHIPAAVWDLTARGEFLTAYTPYQAEASQGTLQLIYEYQSMMTALTGMDASNASVYDGASGLAEAILMAARANKKNKSGRVAVAGSVHPHYVAASRAIVGNQGIELEALPIDAHGVIDAGALASGDEPSDFVAVVIAQPNFFGNLEAVDAITDWAHGIGALVVAVVNPMSLAVLKAPGDWGSEGADIVCGDGQPFGVPMASGGPSFGFMCCKEKFVRQMPGRIIGRTVDLEDRVGFTLTLQAREQHIRRGKATSNICTNQGLLVTAGTIYLSLMGPEGLAEVARRSHGQARKLRDMLTAIDGVSAAFDAPMFHEFVVQLPTTAAGVVAAMRSERILPGLALDAVLPNDTIKGVENMMLVAVTEKRTDAELALYQATLRRVLESRE